MEELLEGRLPPVDLRLRQCGGRPAAALREALLNAVVHKDYSSGIPIQISVWNPGDLPENWTLAKLLGKHPSCPFNPLLANAFFRAGYIESWGRGIEKIQRECREHGIEPPLYDFGMAGLMLTFRANPAHTREVTGEVTGKVTGEVERLTLEFEGQMSRARLQQALGLRHEDHFRQRYLIPALQGGIVEMTIPDRPKSSRQQYRLTAKGAVLRVKLLKEKGT
jgi:ATP-dependent DNA helicase RecG